MLPGGTSEICLRNSQVEPFKEHICVLGDFFSPQISVPNYILDECWQAFEAAHNGTDGTPDLGFVSHSPSLSLKFPCVG